MTASVGRFLRLSPSLAVLAVAATLALAGCASKPKSELAVTSEPAAKPDDKADDKTKDGAKDNKPDNPPSAAPAAAPAEVKKLSEAESDPGPPLLRHEAAGQCWTVADKRGGSLDAKTRIVDKCIDDKLKADASKRGAPAAR